MKLKSKILISALSISCVFLVIGYTTFISSNSFDTFKTAVFFITLLGIIITMLVAYWISYSFSKSLSDFEKAASELIAGTTDKISAVLSIDDFNTLQELFNAMQVRISRSEKNLQEKEERKAKEFERLKSNLEERMAEQTKELQEKINDLEKFQKLTIDRELKMIELKKQIDRLHSAPPQLQNGS